jgi:hypothetical protein
MTISRPDDCALFFDVTDRSSQATRADHLPRLVSAATRNASRRSVAPAGAIVGAAEVLFFLFEFGECELLRNTRLQPLLTPDRSR